MERYSVARVNRPDTEYETAITGKRVFDDLDEILREEDVRYQLHREDDQHE
jgi:hypothetical protein